MIAAAVGFLWILASDIVAGETGRFEVGVTEQNLQWVAQGDLEAQLAVIDALADAGAKWVRLTLRKPFAPLLLGHIRRANTLGLQVLIHLESGDPAWYAPGTERRPGNHGKGGCAWDSYPISELDLDRAETYVREFFELLEAEGATIGAVEMFNEINWNAFNGDLPLAEGGLWIDESTPWDDPVFVKYRAGLEKIGKLTRIVARYNRKCLGGSARIVTCGQVGGFYEWKSNPRISAWFAKVQGVVVSHDLTLQLLSGKHPRQTGAPDYLEDADRYGLWENGVLLPAGGVLREWAR